jgi:hypothetical protein
MHARTSARDFVQFIYHACMHAATVIHLFVSLHVKLRPRHQSYHIPDATDHLAFVSFHIFALLDSSPFSFQNFAKFFQDSPSHRIFRRIHKTLNIDKNKTNFTV